MKSIRLLVTLLLVTLCTGFYSCDKELDRQPLEELSLYGDSFSSYGLNFMDYECNGTYYNGNINHFSGLKNNHLWISSYDRTTKEKLFEWTDTRTFDRNRRVHVGYGEYKDVTLLSITTYGTCYKNNSLVATLSFSFGEGYSEHLILFKSPSSVREVPSKYQRRSIIDWYKESVVVENCCYNNLGDTLFVVPRGIRGMPVSYEEGIALNYSLDNSQSLNIGRWNFKLDETVWNTEVKLPFTVTSDAKTSCNLIEKSTNIWKYRFDIIYYDGAKKDYTFDINIETGALIGDEQPITLASLKGTWDMTKCYGWEYNDKGVKEDWTEDVKGEYIFFEDEDGNGGYNDGFKTYYFASSINGNKLVLRNSDWLEGKDVTITKLTNAELYITATDKVSEENYEMKRR